MRRSMLLAVAIALAAPAVVAQTFSNLGLPPENVAPGSVILAQVVQFTVAAGTTVTITAVDVQNTEDEGPPDLRVLAAHVEYIEVRRNTETGPLLKRHPVVAGDELLPPGIAITGLASNTFSAGTHWLYVLVKLKTDVPVDRVLSLGNTVITAGITPPTPLETAPIPVTHPPDAATFTTRLPEVAFLVGDPPGGNVYRGQRFLAARIELDAEDLPFETTVSQLMLKNLEMGSDKLSGTYIGGIEVRRASDDALLGQQTTASELSKLTTTGTVVATSSNNKVPPYSTVLLEVWVTLKLDAPTNRKLELGATLRLGGPGVAAAQGKDIEPINAAPQFTVGEPSGLDPITNLDVPGTGGQVFSGQRFLAQRIEVVDFDDDPYDVTINSLVVQNSAPDNRLADTQISRIEVIRARDGAAMGQVTSASGLSSGGVRIATGASNVVQDDTTEILELWVTLAGNVPHDRKIQLQTVVWHTEDTKTFGKGHDGPESPVFITGPAAGDGFETTDAATLTDRTVFQGARFVAQRLILEDDDLDPYDVFITSVMVRNVAGTSVLADQHVGRLEVRRASDGALLGEVVDPVGLSLAGVRVTTSENNVVPDDTGVELEIWITLKPSAPPGRKLKLESVVWHTEGTATFQKGPPAGPATFTTELGDPPTGVDFTWTPEAPNAEDEITFTPAAGIADPEGVIANATFSWTFGDGSIAQTTGSLAVKHTYNKGGTFSVTLTVTGVGGLSASKTHEVQVKGQEPTVDFTFTPPAPMVGQEIQFTSVVTDPATPPLTPYTYAWDFDDEATSTEANPRHTYTATGTYTVTLEVTNSEGETGRVSRTITVIEPVDVPPTVTNLTANPANPEVGEVTFTAPATAPAGDPVTGWEWDFGDGSAKSTTTAGTVKHTFAASSVFTVSVRAQNAKGGWSQPRTLSLYVRPKGGALIGTKPLDNPARTQARIQLFLPQGASGVKIQIFDLVGRTVRTGDVSGTQFNWDLRDGNGRALADGIYFYLVTATVADRIERSAVGRILVVR